VREIGNKFLLIASAVVLTWIIVEGLWVIGHWGYPTSSIAIRNIQLIWGKLSSTDETTQAVDSDPLRNALGEPPILDDEQVLMRLLPDLKQAHVLFGNSPFHELATPEARYLYNDQTTQTLRVKPNNQATMAFIRTRLYTALDPLVYVVRTNVQVSEPIAQFFQTYGFVKTIMTSNQFEERVTVPESKARDVVLVAGDSVAFGVMVNDDEHLASRLQQKTSTRKFVNLGISGGSLRDSLVVMHEAVKRYGDRIIGLIYIQVENDFVDGQTPFSIMEQLSAFVATNNIHNRLLVYHQYVYRTMPEIFRDETESYGEYQQLKEESLALAQSSGFQILNVQNLVETYRVDAGSQMAGAALYVDRIHLSVAGTRLVANTIHKMTHQRYGAY